ncbi:FolC bifunctional protein [Xylariaceae sp. FL0662B]|nr:FolC bifunctional protein [Xylariaceae sp. FL0662B]
MAHTYEAALARLSSIQSNRAIHSLFSPIPTPTSSTSPTTTPTTAQDLNALAIPEMLTWLQRAGLSQADLARLRCVHVAGTKGKGSVSAYLTSVLTQREPRAVAGRVGTYTSPHLLSVRERIQIDGAPLGPAQFARYFFEVWDALTASARAEAARQRGTTANDPVIAEDADLDGPATKPFYFRFLTLVALRAFLGEGVRTAVVECGIGGEYDSTNVLPAGAVTASVVSQLGVDHVGMLGATVPEIAWHKAGVCKPGRKCFTRRRVGEEGEATMRVLRRRAAEKGAVLVEVDDRDVEAWGGVASGLEGAFQKYNQALAVCAAREHLRVLEVRLDTDAQVAANLTDLPESFVRGLRQARLRGRCETRREGNCTWFIDGAHTAESLEEVAKWFAEKRVSLADARTVLLFNQQDRNAANLLGGLYESIERASGTAQGAIFDLAIFTRNDLESRAPGEPERDLTVQQAATDAMRQLCPQTETFVVDNVGEAVAKVRALAQSDNVKFGVLATGSLHLVGALLRTLEPEAEL